MKDLLKYIWKYRKRVALGILALFLVDAGRLVIPQIIRFGVDDIKAGVTSNLLWFFLGILGLGVVVAVFRFFWRYLLIGVSRRIRRDLRNVLYDKVLKFSQEFYQDHKTGDLMAHFTNDTNAVMRACGFGAIMFADVLFMAGFSITAMVLINPELTLYAFAPLPVMTVTVYFFGKIIHRRFQVVQNVFSKLSDRVQEALSGIRVVKSYTREEEMEEDFEEPNKDYLDRNIDLVKYQGFLQPAIALLSSLSTLVILYWGGRLTILQTLSLGELLAFILYLNHLVWPMRAIGRMVNVWQRGTASMERINKILNTDPTITDPPDARDFTGPGKIEIKNLSFSYDGQTPVLNNINLEVNPGQTLGIIGQTGSGKSTLVHLLVRVFDPPPEQIFIDGTDVRDYALNELRGHISLVPQEGFLFSSSARENISFGKPEADLDEIKEAAQLAGIHEDIVRMSDGYDSLLGERGVSLSGGQKQRISIARAIITDPEILILDDALSSVDSRKEEEILHNLREILESRTSIVIAHRISAVKNLDKIITMENGKITEKGTHEELQENNGLYARLFELQKARKEVERR